MHVRHGHCQSNDMILFFQWYWMTLPKTANSPCSKKMDSQFHITNKLALLHSFIISSISKNVTEDFFFFFFSTSYFCLATKTKLKNAKRKKGTHLQKVLLHDWNGLAMRDLYIKLGAQLRYFRLSNVNNRSFCSPTSYVHHFDTLEN